MEYKEVIALIKNSLNQFEIIKKKIDLESNEANVITYSISHDDLKHQMSISADFPDGHEVKEKINCNDLFKHELKSWSHKISIVDENTNELKEIDEINYVFEK